MTGSLMKTLSTNSPMKLKAESAHLFFIVCTKQLLNGVICAQTYRQRLEHLLKMMKKSDGLYEEVSIILGIEGDMSNETLETVIESKSDGNYTSLVDYFHQNNTSLYFQGTIRIADPDPWPSIPHLHIEDKRTHKIKKVNVFTGNSTDGGSYSINELIHLWNDIDFIKKIQNNLSTICSKQNKEE